MSVATQFSPVGRWLRATIGNSALIGGDLLNQILNSEDLLNIIQENSSDVIVNRFNVELKDLTGKRLGWIFDPDEQPTLQDYDRATVSFPSNGIIKNFEIGLPFFQAPVYANVVPGNLNAVGDFFVTYDVSKIIVGYRVAPAPGGIILHYEARRV